MKRVLLLGAGHSRQKMITHAWSPEPDFSACDLVIHDIDPGVTEATRRFDLNQFPYLLGDEEFDEIHAYEVLEHTGRQGDAGFFFGQFRELWRALKPNGLLMLSVPIWNSDVAWGVPDHCRVLPPCVFGFLSPEYERRFGHVPGAGDYSRWRKGLDLRVIDQAEHRGSSRYFVLLQAVK